jgi:DNA-binding response OmpR family regulator
MPASILIVEDEWLIAEDYVSVLRDAGHAIVGPCRSVKAAIAAMRRERIDAALLDMDLGGEKSFPVADRLKEIDVPFTFLSGHDTLELPLSPRDQIVLSKPVQRATLLAAVTRMYPGP